MCLLLQRLYRSNALKFPLSYCACSSNSRRYASTPAAATSTTTPKSDRIPTNLDVGFTEWRPIYRLPLIRLVAAFNRLKVYQAIVTAAGTPIAFALQHAGHVSEDALGIYAAIGVSGLMTLTLGSYVARNVVGFIYINELEDQLRLAYVDFWGRRKEHHIDIEDLLPDWEPQGVRRLGSFYQPVCLRNNDKLRFKLLHRFGVITDPLLFEGLFGK